MRRLVLGIGDGVMEADGKVIYEGKVTSLKRFKEDVREVEKGFECGIGVEGASEIQEGDRIQIFTRVQVPRS